MTKNHDDPNLANFLRQHRPQIPPTSPELEEKVLQQVFQYQEAKSKNIRFPARFRQYFLYLLSPAIAASIVLFLSSPYLLSPQPPSKAELSKIEAFMENNWQGALSENPENSSFD